MYSVDYITEEFRAFVKNVSLVLQLTLDGTETKIFAESMSVNVDVYTRSILPRNANGQSLRSSPVLSRPRNSNASGVLSTIPISELYIDDFTSAPGFKLLLINCDGANTNRKAVRMLMSELHPRRELLIIANFCAAHGLNYAVRWGLGVFGYGNILRPCHVLQSVKHRKFEFHVERLLRADVEEDIQLLSNTAVGCACVVREEYSGLFGNDTPCYQPIEMREQGCDLHGVTKTPENRSLRRRFIMLVTGDNGTFAKIGKTRIAG